MASTWSALKIELLETGQNSGTWGTLTNVNLGDAVLGEAITGSATVDFPTDADVTVTLTDSATSQSARNLRLNITESSTGIGSIRSLILGSGCQIEKFYLINNTGTGAKTVKNTTGTGISVPAGKATLVYNNGTNVVDAASYFTSLTLGSALPVASGGTGVTTSTGTTNVVLSNSPTLVTPALGTPSALVGTNITGTATAFTASNVTTNANLTGAVTSVGNAASLGSFTSLQLLTALTDETGTGAAVFATSPTLVTPALGTPSALVGTNITGTATAFTASNVTTNANLTGGVTSVGNAATVVTNANLTGGVTSVGNAATVVTNANLTGDITSVGNATTLTNAPVIAKVLTGYVSGAGTVSATDSILQAIQKLNGNDATNANLTGAVTSVGNATSLGSFTSAQLLAALTDETGTGANVFATSPTLVTPALGAATATSIVSSGTAASSFTVTSGSAVPLTITNVGTGNSFVIEDSASTDSTPFVINAGGQVVIGHTAQLSGSQYNPNLEVFGADPSASSIGQFQYSADGNSSIFQLNKTRGTAPGTQTIVLANDNLGTIQFSGSDGTGYIRGASITATVDGTPGTNDMPGRLIFSTTADGASSPTERMRIDSVGNVGIGATTVAGYTIWNGKTVTGGTSAAGQINIGVIQSDVTALASIFKSQPSTAAAAFTLTNLRLYDTFQSTIGAGSAVTNQVGFYASTTLTGATNNYGFFSEIAAAANRFNFYAAGTAANFFAGNVGIGAALTNVSLYNTRNISGNSQSYGNYTQATIQSDVTSAAFGHRANLSTVAAAFTLSSLYNFYAGQGTIGAASAVTSQFGYIAENSLIGATNNYGFYSDIASGTNRYNFYANGTAANYFAGSVGIGAVPTSASKTSIVSTSAGASTIALALQNLSDTINTETVLDISCYSGTTPGVRSAQITALNVSGGTTVNMVFKISNGAVPAEAMRITSLGGLKIQTGVAVGAATPGTSGVAFPATAVAVADANTLDDYEEGTWTPTIAFGGLAVGVTYTANSGQYTKIGKVVYFQLVLTLSSKGSSTGAFTVLGLPFTPDSATYPVVFRPSGMTSGVGDTYLVARVSSSDTTISASKYSLGSLVALTDADFANTSFFSIAGFYQV